MKKLLMFMVAGFMFSGVASATDASSSQQFCANAESCADLKKAAVKRVVVRQPASQRYTAGKAATGKSMARIYNGPKAYGQVYVPQNTKMKMPNLYRVSE
jgi:hypothetical protein